MNAVRTLLSRLLDLVLANRRNARLDDEIREHLRALRAEHERRGMSPVEADFAARRSFGGVDQVKRRYMDQRGSPAIESLVQDLRFACRFIRRDTATSVPLLGVLALGIGVGHMFFTLTYAHTLRGLPVDEVERVFAISALDAKGERPLTFADFAEIRDAQRTFASLAAYVTRPVTVNVADQVPDRFAGTFTTASGLEVARVAPVLGRLLTADDDRPGSARAALLVERLWRSRFSADPNVLGTDIVVDGIPATVVGVTPDKSGFPSAAMVFLPLSARSGAGLPNAVGALVRVFGRLAPSVSAAAAQGDLNAIAAAMGHRRAAADRDVRLQATAINDQLIGGRIGGWLPFIAAGLIVVLVSATNAGNLVLAAALARRREIAIRTALGASRLRVARQLLIESLLFAALAAAAGLLLSRAGVAVYSSEIPAESMPYWFDYSVNGTVFLWLCLIALAMLAVFSLVPAWHASRTAVVEVLKDGGRADTARGSLGASAFLAVQLGLAVIVVAQVGTAVFTLEEAVPTDPLLDDERVLLGGLDLPADRYASPEARQDAMRRVFDALIPLRGVEAVAFSSAAPLDGVRELGVRVEGHADSVAVTRAPVVSVSARYFDVLGLGIVRGRAFDDRDGRGGDATVIVNERFASTMLPAVDAVGQRIAVQAPGDTGAAAWATIVGVVPNLRQRDRRPAAPPMVYTPIAASWPSTVTLLVRGDGPGAALTPPVRDAIRRVDPFLPLARARSLPTVVRDGTWVSRVSARLATTVSSAAFAMAAFGVFAVITHRMLRRRRELGLRMALGAEARHIAGTVVGSVYRSIAAGLVLGVVGVLAWERAFAPAAADAPSRGPVVLAATIPALLAVVVAGCVVPILRARRIAPAEVLRRE